MTIVAAIAITATLPCAELIESLSGATPNRIASPKDFDNSGFNHCRGHHSCHPSGLTWPAIAPKPGAPFPEQYTCLAFEQSGDHDLRR